MEKNVNGLVNQMNRMNVTIGAFKVLIVVSLVLTAVVALASIYLYSTGMAQMQSRIYVLDQGRSFSAVAQDESITREDEIRHHVRSFHELMFNIPPNREMIARNLERAFDMCDNSAYKYYNDLQETGFYKRMIGTNSYQQLVIESIEVNMASYPYQVVVKGSQYITRESNLTKYTFVSRCRVANAVRTPDNLHGLMMENFEVIENDFVETRNK